MRVVCLDDACLGGVRGSREARDCPHTVTRANTGKAAAGAKSAGSGGSSEDATATSAAGAEGGTGDKNLTAFSSYREGAFNAITK